MIVSCWSDANKARRDRPQSIVSLACFRISHGTSPGGMPALHRRASSRLHLFRADLGWCQVIHPTTSFAPAPQVTARQRNIAITEINKPERNVWIAHDKDIGRLAGCCNFKAPVWVSHPKLAREGTIIGGEAVSGPRFRGPKNAAETSDRENPPCSAMALSFVG
jgi:hypothetical protein